MGPEPHSAVHGRVHRREHLVLRSQALSGMLTIPPLAPTTSAPRLILTRKWSQNGGKWSTPCRTMLSDKAWRCLRREASYVGSDCLSAHQPVSGKSVISRMARARDSGLLQH